VAARGLFVEHPVVHASDFVAIQPELTHQGFFVNQSESVKTNGVMPKTSIGQRARKGVGAVFSGMLFSQLLRFCSSLVLTRLLAPEMYGLMALGNVVVAAVVLMSDVGLIQCIIQRKEVPSQRFLNTVYATQIARGLILSAVLVVFAVVVNYGHAHGWFGEESTFADPQIFIVLLILAAVPLVAGFESTNLALARRELAVGRTIRVDVVAQLLTTLITIALAYEWRETWVLPASWVMNAALRAALTHVMLPGPGNGIGWNREDFMAIFGYSKWIVLSSGVNFFARDGDRLILGALLSSSALGLYSVGTLLLGPLNAGLNRMMGLVGGPALAEVARSDPSRLKQAFIRCRRPIDMVVLAASGFLFAASELVIRILYDQRYIGASTTLSILALSLIGTRFTVIDQYLLATGETKELFKRSLMLGSALFVCVPLGFQIWGETGAIVGVLIARLLAMAVVLGLMAQRHLIDVRYELLSFRFFVLGALAGAVCQHASPALMRWANLIHSA